MRLLPRLLLLLLEDEETVEDSIIEDEDDEAEVEEDEPTDLAEDKSEEEDLSSSEASPNADTTILFLKGEDFPPMGRRPFGLVINLNYKDLNGNVFQDAVFNQLVTVIKREDGLDGETLCICSLKCKRHIQKVEMGTSSQNDVDMSWIPQETLNQINKASSGRLPRKRVQERFVGSGE
ncbi:SSR1-like [Ictidomys tridecemlineatus]|uniref:Uncharacterized protein n=1 Tax=Ictidomys tridecemlineatus TaxID=43179 RepID=A0A287CU96_ICTTR|nr:SSR1-like [Ictidomys tridecemlineatus]